MDNASIHCAAGSFDLMVVLLRAMGVRVIFLPKYSPELNPVELVWARAKRYLREERGNDSFPLEIAKGLACVDRLMVLQFYRHCLLHHEERYTW